MLLWTGRGFVAKDRLGKAIIVARLGIADFGLCLLKLGLTQINDRT